MSDKPSDKPTFVVVMEPVGRRVEVEPGTTLLDAAQAAGVGLVSLCGGEGWCEGCQVRLAAGALTPPTDSEREALNARIIEAGCRLACQARPLGDVKIDIPPESLTAPQRLQVEGLAVEVALAPPVVPVDVTVDPPTLHDLRSDLERLEDALAAAGHAPVTCGHAVLTGISDRLRAAGWQVRVALRAGEVVAILPAASTLYGLAVDLGTTKLAAYLVDLETGETVARTGAMNPQIGYGEDVVSRIAYTTQHDDGRQVLQEKVAATLNTMVAGMCAAVGGSLDQVVEAVIVGNTAMHHLLARLPVNQLALAPYVAAVSRSVDVRAADLGLVLAPGAIVHLPPVIAGYVGADHVAMLLATGIWQGGPPTLAVDIGTNTEISLSAGGRLLSCSCASGPAFEGAHIRDGMRAAPGAVEHVQIVGDEVYVYTIDGEPPVGICGSGILDAVAEMHAAGVLNDKGALQAGHPRVRAAGGQSLEFVLVPGERTGHGKAITLSRQDVNEIQLAKAAIRAGIDILLAEAGIAASDVETFIVAGAFGTYIDIPHAIGIGMFPALPVERFQQVGNAAGIGARLALLSTAQRQAAVEIVRRVEYVELTTHPAFRQTFMKAMFL